MNIKAFVVLLLISPFSIQSSADVVVLISGETLQVHNIEVSDKLLKATHDILGDLSIPMSDVERFEIEQLSPKSPIGSPTSQMSSIDEPSGASGWKHSLSLGVGYLNAEHENLDLSASYHAEKQSTRHLETVDISYRFSESDETRTTNWFSASLGHTWEQPDDPWDVFTTLQFDWSEFQSWDQRIIGDAGIQFLLLEERFEDSIFQLGGRVGGGARKEFNSHNEDVVPEGLIGLSCNWKIGDSQSLSADSTWYPDFNDLEHYRIVTKATWNIKLEDLENLSFSIGLHHEYDSNVDVSSKNAFLQVTAGVNYSF